MTLTNRRTAARALVDQLVIQGVDTVFCVPGESYLAVLDAFHDTPAIRLIVCRQEGGAANMAEAYAKATGKPGICFVTRGPGITNASIGIHTAQQDSTPIIVFMGQVGRGEMEREAFQELDVRKVFASMTKWAAQIDVADRVPELVSHAFHVALAGRPGPVVVALPEDMLVEETTAVDVPRARPATPKLADGDVAAIRERLASAERPLVLVGGPGWSLEAREAVQAFAAASGLPIATTMRAQGHIDNAHSNYVGDVGIGPNPLLAEMVKKADLMLVIGARLGEMTTGGYTLVRSPIPDQALIHIHPSAEEPGSVFHPAMAIAASGASAAAALARMEPIDGSRWAGWLAEGRAGFAKWREPDPAKVPGSVDMGAIVRWLGQACPPDTIVTNGAGNYAGWFHRYFPHRGWPSQIAPTSGAMGYGVPAAIAAKLAYPERTVISANGDGCFMMCGQELATAMQYGVGVIFLVVDNGMYGTIRMHQEREFPGRISATELRNPDFAGLARAYGAHGETVVRTEEFAPAFERARAAGVPALIHIRIDPEAITSRTTLSAIREAALKRPGG